KSHVNCRKAVTICYSNFCPCERGELVGCVCLLSAWRDKHRYVAAGASLQDHTETPDPWVDRNGQPAVHAFGAGASDRDARRCSLDQGSCLREESAHCTCIPGPQICATRRGRWNRHGSARLAGAFTFGDGPEALSVL